jgi:hypothetical protein
MSDLMLIVPDSNDLDPRALAERRRKKARRRVAAWSAFLLVGMALGTIYATGFATNNGSTDAGGSGPAAAAGMDPGDNQDTSVLANSVSSPNSLQYTWSGRWGSFASNQHLFTVDLDEPNIQAGTYYVELLLSNTPDGFSDLQIRFALAGDGGDGCQASDLNTAPTNRVMIFDTEDSQVTWPNLSTGVYCVGVQQASGKDTSGTFIRKVNTGQTFNGTYPQFVATVNRSG